MRALHLLLALSLACGLSAQDSRELRIATKVTPPFVTKQGDSWSGLSVELWRLVQERLGVTSEFEEMELSGMLDATASKRCDMALGAITVTAERLERLEFSHPFLSSGLGIATRAEEQGLVGAIFDRLVSFNLLTALAALGSVLAICGLLVWIVERKANPEDFGGKGIEGLGQGFWFSAVTMTTVGYGDKAPKTFVGRSIALVWMFASIVIISSYTAAIASALTVDRIQSAVRGPEDLPKARIGTVSRSAASGWLEGEKLDHATYPDIPQAMAALGRGQLDAVVYDAPILRSLTSQGGKIRVLPHILRREHYALALPQGSPLRVRLNKALLEVLESPAWTTLRSRYLGR